MSLHDDEIVNTSKIFRHCNSFQMNTRSRIQTHTFLPVVKFLKWMSPLKSHNDFYDFMAMTFASLCVLSRFYLSLEIETWFFAQEAFTTTPTMACKVEGWFMIWNCTFWHNLENTVKVLKTYSCIHWETLSHLCSLMCLMDGGKKPLRKSLNIYQECVWHWAFILQEWEIDFFH